MQVALASCRSPDAATNEDFVAATASVVIVLDGASAPTGVETGCVHGTIWFAAEACVGGPCLAREPLAWPTVLD